MNFYKIAFFFGLLAVVFTLLLVPTILHGEEPAVPRETPKLSHAQEVWLGALEWCESRGNTEAINPKDLDNTPSYGAFQFKPSTLTYYAKKYGVAIATSTMDYVSQRAVVEQMVLHREEIKWIQQFPWCVKKLGLPPKP